MELKDYTTEELKAELKRRSEEKKAEMNKVKRCRMCKHWGEIDYWGNPVSVKVIYYPNKCCKFFHIGKSKTYYKCHKPYEIACEHFEELSNI